MIQKFEQYIDSLNESSNKLKLSDSFEYKLKDDKVLKVEAYDGPGMAGENMTFVYLTIDGKNVNFKNIQKDFINDKDKKELSKYLEEINDINYSSAISFIK